MGIAAACVSLWKGGKVEDGDKEDVLSRPETDLMNICIVSTTSGDAERESENEERMLAVDLDMLRGWEGRIVRMGGLVVNEFEC